MKAADLSHAQALVDKRADDQSLLDIVSSGGELRLSFGHDQREIILSPEYAERIRQDVLQALHGRIAALDAELVALGVEP